MPICNTCHEKPIIPVELKCGHNFCFLCITPVIDVINNGSCPDLVCGYQDKNYELCNDEKTEHVGNSEYYVWLYSSNYGNTWWCYQREICGKVEKIYMDYCLRQKILSNDNSVKDISLTIHKKSVSTTSLPKVGSFVELDNDSDNTETESVDFESISGSESDKEELKEKKNQIISYNVTIYGTEYKLDFDLMKQINLNDTMKKRNIKRVEIPNEYRNKKASDIKQYLVNTYLVLGISGKKF